MKCIERFTDDGGYEMEFEELYPGLKDIAGKRFSVFLERKVSRRVLKSFLSECEKSKSIDGEALPGAVVWDDYAIRYPSGNMQTALSLVWENGHSNYQNGSVLSCALSRRFDTRVAWNRTHCVHGDDWWIVRMKVSGDEDGDDLKADMTPLHLSPVCRYTGNTLDIGRLLADIRLGEWRGIPKQGEAKRIRDLFRGMDFKQREKAVARYRKEFLARAVAVTGKILFSMDGTGEDPGRKYAYYYRTRSGADFVFQLEDSIHWPSTEQWASYTAARRRGAKVRIWYDAAVPGVHLYGLGDEMVSG